MPTKERCEAKLDQEQIDAFAQHIYAKRFEKANKIFNEHLHDVAPALYNRFLDYEVRDLGPYAPEDYGFSSAIEHFNLKMAKEIYNLNIHAVSRFLLNYYKRIALEIEGERTEEEQSLKSKFPEISTIVDYVLAKNPDEGVLAIIRAFTFRKENKIHK
jgi:hypothetical protein